MFPPVSAIRSPQCHKLLQTGIWAFALLGLIVASQSRAQQWAVPEFVSLDQAANFENGSLQFGGQTYQIDMISEAEDDAYTGNIANAPGASLYMSSVEDAQIDVYFEYQGYQFRGSGLSRNVRPSNVITGFKVTEYRGVLFNADDQQFPALLSISESLEGGGDSQLRIWGEYAYLSGDLGTRTYNQIFSLIHNQPNVRTIIEQNVSGSVNDDINMQTGRLIRRAGLATHIPADGEAHSGGVDLFSAGVNRSVAPGGKVGVHSWSEDDLEARFIPAESPRHFKQINYFNEMLGSPAGREFYFFTIYAAPADGMHLMTPEELARFGLVTQ